MRLIHDLEFFSILESNPLRLFASSRLSRMGTVLLGTTWLATAIASHASPFKELLSNNNLPRNCPLKAHFVL